MKKLLCVLLALLLVCAAFTGCAKTETPDTAQSSAVSNPVSEAPSASGAGFDKLDVVLFTGGYGDMWQELVDLFKEYYPDVEVSADLGSDVESRIRTRMMTDTPPDVVFISGSNEYDIFEAANSGLLMDLSDWFVNGVNADGEPMSEVLSESRLASGTINGAVYLPTWGTGYGGWWYNAALFEAHGWQVPATWDEFQALCADIQDAGIIPLMYQAVNYAIWGYLYQALACAGGYDAYADCLINLEEGAWTSDAALTAATKMYALVSDGYLSQTSVAVEFTQAQIDFINDRVAMIPCGSWFENEMKQSTPEGFEMSFMAFPDTDSDGSHYITAFDTTICCTANAQNPEAAKAFLGVIYSKEGQKIIAKYGSLPVTNNITTDDIAEYMTPTMETVVNRAADGDIKFVSNNPESWYAAMWPTLQDCITNLVLQDITPEQFCQTMEEAAAAIRADDSIPKYSSD